MPKIATTAVIDSRDRWNDGTRVAPSMWCHGSLTTKTTPTYVRRDRQSHFRYGTSAGKG